MPSIKRSSESLQPWIVSELGLTGHVQVRRFVRNGLIEESSRCSFGFANFCVVGEIACFRQLCQSGPWHRATLCHTVVTAFLAAIPRAVLDVCMGVSDPELRERLSGPRLRQYQHECEKQSWPLWKRLLHRLQRCPICGPEKKTKQ